MAVTEPIVFQHAYDLAKWYAQRTAGFPRPYRGTIGDRIQHSLITLLEALQDAAYGKNRTASLGHAQDLVDRLRLYNRLARDLRCVAPNQYTYAAERIEEIGRQIGGWTRSSGARPRDARPTDGAARSCGPGRQLEQRPRELPVSEPEQERPREPEQQHRVPAGVAEASSTSALPGRPRIPGGE